MTKTESDWPEIDITLVRWLKTKYPLKAPDLSSGEREIFFESGRQSLIEELEQMNTVQNDILIDQHETVEVDNKYTEINLNKEGDTS